MKANESVFAFDVGWSFHGWATKTKENTIDTGVYGFEHNDAHENYMQIRRVKNRKKSKNKRLEKLKSSFVNMGIAQNINELEQKLQKSSHNNQLWLNLIRSHYEQIEPFEFVQILYRFAKRRHYVDMRKKKNDHKTNGEKKKEEGDIKKSLSAMENAYKEHKPKDGELKTWFSALFKRREELIMQIEKHAIIIDREKFPYTNTKLSKIFGKEQYAKLKKDEKLTGYELLLRNDQIAQSLKVIAKKQKELGADHSIFSEEFMDYYVGLITFKGVQPSLEDKIGMCLSGEDRKRHPKSSIDAEVTRIKESYFYLFIEVDKDGHLLKDEDGKTKEMTISELGIDYETYYEMIYQLSSNNQKGEITTKKILDRLKKEQSELKNRYFIYKNFKHRQDHDKATVLRLPGHRRLYDLSENFRHIFMTNDSLRDTIEFEMLCYRNPDTLKERLENILKQNKIGYEQNDIEILSVADVGKPAPCNNETYREIQEFLEQGKNFQTALIEKHPNAIVNIKRDYRKFLNYKMYLQKQKRQGIYNSFQNKVVEEFIFLFNRLVQKYGEADRIVLETTREILSEAEKKAIVDRIKDNEKLNKNIEKLLDAYVEKYKKKPSKRARERLKLFVQQGGELKFNGKSAKCVLTGNPISVEAAIEGDRTNTDHIIPQTWIHDNRLDNKILLDRAVNQKEKEDATPIQYLYTIGYSPKEAKEKLKENIKGMKLSKTKVKHIFEEREKEKIKKDAEDRIHSMDQRMKGIQDASIKIIMDLLVDQYRFNSDEKLSLAKYREKVLPVTGKMTSIFRRGWIKDYRKDRAKLYNHAIDALVMLNFDRAFLTQYITLLKQSYLEDKNPIWIAKEKMFPVIEDFDPKVHSFIKEYEEQSRVVVRYPTKKFIGRIYQQMPRDKNDKHAIKTKKHYFAPDSGFTKLIFYKTVHIKRKKEVEGIGAIRLHPSNNQHIESDQLTIAAEAYRNSLLFVRNKTLCGYYYLIGYSKQDKAVETIELKNAVINQENRIRPDITAVGFELEVIKKLPINGRVKKPSCNNG